MKYTYRFVDGKTQTIDVSEEHYTLLVNEDRKEYNNDQTKMTRTGRFVSLDMALDKEGMQFADPGSLPPTETAMRVQCALEALPSRQRAMIRAVYYEGLAISEYAKRQGVSQPAISQRLKTVQKNLRKTLSAPYI